MDYFCLPLVSKATLGLPKQFSADGGDVICPQPWDTSRVSSRIVWIMAAQRRCCGPAGVERTKQAPGKSHWRPDTLTSTYLIPKLKLCLYIRVIITVFKPKVPFQTNTKQHQTGWTQIWSQHQKLCVSLVHAGSFPHLLRPSGRRVTSHECWLILTTEQKFKSI